MKVGGDNKVKMALACGLGVIAVLVLVWSARQMGGGQSSGSAAPVVQPHAQPQSAVAGAAAVTDPSLRLGELAQSQDIVYKPAGRDLYTSQPEPGAVKLPKVIKTPLKSMQKPGPVVPQVPTQTPAPAIPFKYAGLVSGKGSAPRALLTREGSVYAVTQGEIIERRYKILNITPSGVEVEDLFYNSKQTLPAARS